MSELKSHQEACAIVDALWGSKWSTKRDEELTAVLKGDDPVDVERAMTLLQARHHGRLIAYIRAKVPEDWVEDVIQETWLGFYQTVRRDAVVGNVSALINRIAQRRRVDAIRKLMAERQIELDLDPVDSAYDDESQGFAADSSLEDRLQQAEAAYRNERLLNALPRLPFMDSVLSDCQRVLWVLRELYDYPSKTVARLMGKSVSNINAQTSQARRRVLGYFASEDFELSLVAQELPPVWRPASIPRDATMIERFAEPALPQLTPDELQPLGLTSAELQKHYVVSLMLPRWHRVDGGQSTTPPYLVLTQKSDWAQMQRLFAQLARGPTALPDEFPEEALIRVDVEEENVRLRVEPIHQMVPDDPLYSLDTNTYLSVHSPRLSLPVALAAFSRAEYTPALLRRWPFATLAEDW